MRSTGPWRNRAQRPSDRRCAGRRQCAGIALPYATLHGIVDAHGERLDDAPFAGLGRAVGAISAAIGGRPARSGGTASSADLGRSRTRRCTRRSGRLTASRAAARVAGDACRGPCLLPRDLLAAHGVTVDLLRSGASHDGLVALSAEVASHAREAQVSGARGVVGGPPPTSRTASATCPGSALFAGLGERASRAARVAGCGAADTRVAALARAPVWPSFDVRKVYLCATTRPRERVARGYE